MRRRIPDPEEASATSALRYLSRFYHPCSGPQRPQTWASSATRRSVAAGDGGAQRTRQRRGGAGALAGAHRGGEASDQGDGCGRAAQRGRHRTVPRRHRHPVPGPYAAAGELARPSGSGYHRAR
eukprot:ctg_1813.g499